jgi:hypothetical protein
MKDLTQGSMLSHISTMAPQIFAGMIMIMLCQLIDLYFVSGLGDAAIAGVAAAGNTGFLITALTQVLSVGTQALISHAVGRKDRADANLVFNQSLVLSARDIGADCRICSCTRLHVLGCRKRCRRRSRYDVSALAHAGAGAAVRHAGADMCLARHRHRAAHHDRPDDHGDHQYHSCSRSRRRLGHRSGFGALPVLASRARLRLSWAW